MKKILALVLAITTVLALAVPAMAGKDPVPPQLTFDFEKNNANFHCNDIEGENGRVWPEIGDSKSANGNNKTKTTEVFTVTREDGTTTKWTLSNVVECPACGRTEWVTFSNNSGVPNGNNVQFQHPAPSKKYVTIKVIYHLDIPQCKIKCINKGAKCNFVCISTPPPCTPCPYKVSHPHDCKQKCGVGHECPFNDETLDLTCKTVCPHYYSYTELKLTKKVLIRITDGLLVNPKNEPMPFVYTPDPTWTTKDGKSGNLFRPTQITVTTFTGITEYHVYYRAKGDCKCNCPKVRCYAKCKTCDFTPPPPPSHTHVPVCENCKGGNGKNHENCEDMNSENNTNYYCLDCPDNNNKDLKLGAYHAGDWDIKVAGWVPGDYPGTCKCTHK